MKTDTPKTIYLKDYAPYPFRIEHIDLLFQIFDGHTIVTTETRYQRQSDGPLFLYGEDLELLSIKLDGAEPSYTSDDKSLTITDAPDTFTLKVVTKIVPEDNTYLEGLYRSGGTYCTQCEAEGFRRITYYPDRPDVMTTFTTRIEADAGSCPVLLGNGNKVDEGALEGGRHFAVWNDPHPKPCYLFALVAGDLNYIHDTFTTASGREVDLYIYVRAGDEGQCGHAMKALKDSMKWDEDTYGLEYDLDIFNIVAVSDFNMGAMENKSLNIFNTALVLAHPDTATDQDFIRVESVIAHEYFHNWSGNRITCRDWFQLSLKEGLTVFRDQEFSSDMNSRDAARIDDVEHLRRFQFPEDGGPLKHPIRPEEYIEINNFYTMTVYEKGAEVIRMFRTLMGPENYRKATDLYFSRHDGQAATCENWITCMEEASGLDLAQFRLWYSTPGTPEVCFKGAYDAAEKTYTLSLSQDQAKPMHIPVAVGLLSDNGDDLIGTRVLELREKSQDFVIEDVPSKPVPSVLRGFSAPVKLVGDLTDTQLAFLMVHDSDGFNRWEAGQTLALRALKSGDLDLYIQSYGRLLGDTSDPALLARAMSVPSVNIMGQHEDLIDPETLHAKRQKLLAKLKHAFKPELKALYAQMSDDRPFSVSAEAMGRRALRNAALGVLTTTKCMGCRARAKEQYDGADNMTDRLAALSILAGIECEESAQALSDFHARFKDYPLVMDKWFAVQASAARDDIIQIIRNLRKHADFNIKNPNRTRSLYASFGMNNPAGFHRADGLGYRFLRDGIIELNAINPQIAARLLTPFKEWKRYTPDRQEKMKAALEEILAQPNLSPNVFEIASKSLNA